MSSSPTSVCQFANVSRGRIGWGSCQGARIPIEQLLKALEIWLQDAGDLNFNFRSPASWSRISNFWTLANSIEVREMTQDVGEHEVGVGETPTVKRENSSSIYSSSLLHLISIYNIFLFCGWLFQPSIFSSTAILQACCDWLQPEVCTCHLSRKVGLRYRDNMAAVQEERKNILCLFDVDGTLTMPRLVRFEAVLFWSVMVLNLVIAMRFHASSLKLISLNRIFSFHPVK